MADICKTWLYLILFIFVTDSCMGFDAYCSDNFQVSGQNYCYMVSTVKLPWRKAYKECYKYNADLVRIFDNNTLKAVVSLVNGTTGTRWWTALNDRKNVGEWVWGVNKMRTMVDLNVVQWIQEPDEVNHRQNCAAINFQGSMSDERCWDWRRYICEYANTPGTPCAKSWTNYTNGCYLFPTGLQEPFSKLTWNKARQKCINVSQELAGLSNVKTHLLLLDSQDELDYIRRTLSSLHVTSEIWWIGLNDSSKEGQWKWVDGTPLTNPIWAQEPNNLGGQERCGYINGAGQFGDLPCNQSERYICYKENDGSFAPNLGTYGCPAGWTRAGHYCYHDVKRQMSWLNASMTCQSYGSNLIKVDDPDKRDWLQNQNNLFSRGRWFWTGLNKRQSTNWLWADNSPANMSLIKWNTEPNNYQGIQNCAVILKPGTFDDVACIQQYGFICEQNLEDSPCPAGWITKLTPDHSNCYYISNTTANFDEAHAQCNQLSFPTESYLVALNTKLEIASLTKYLQAQKGSVPGWYTGLTDAGHEGIWTYDTKYNPAPASGLIPWSKFPEFVDGDENCVAVVWGGNYLNSKCDTKKSFICERPAAGYSVNAGSRVFLRKFSLSSIFIIIMYFVVYALCLHYILHLTYILFPAYA